MYVSLPGWIRTCVMRLVRVYVCTRCTLLFLCPTLLRLRCQHSGHLWHGSTAVVCAVLVCALCRMGCVHSCAGNRPPRHLQGWCDVLTPPGSMVVEVEGSNNPAALSFQRARACVSPMGRVCAASPTCRASHTAERGASEATCLDCMLACVLVLSCLVSSIRPCLVD